MKVLQLVQVKRESPEAREETKQTILRYAESQMLSEKFPKLVIFPQGTTTKDSYLTMFQRGAFVSGLPVQPVALKYRWKYFNPAYIVNRKTDHYFLRMFCQFSIPVEVTFLPLYTPTSEEAKDATLFAEKVKDQLSLVLNAKKTNHCYEDAKLYRVGLNIKEKRFPLKMFRPVTNRERVNLHGFHIKEIKDIFTHHESESI